MSAGDGSAVPRRKCVGCRATAPKPDLVRLVVGAEETVTLDILGRLPGRGAYLCRTTGASCLGEARRRRALTRQLRVGEDAVDYARLDAEIDGLNR